MTQDTPAGINSASRLRTAYQAWHNFWFRPADTLTLGIMRLLTGGMLVYNLLVWSLDLQAFFGSNGLQPAEVIKKFHGTGRGYSFLFYVTDEWLATVHWTCVAIAVMFCLGIGTRVTAILAWAITISYSQRVPVANFGLDQILGLLCMYLAIGPSGDSLSVDAWLRHRRVPLLPRPPKASAQMTLRLIQIHVCVIYFWAGFAKLKGDSWWTGEAMWQVLANQEYQTMDLTWMASVPWLPYLIAHITVAWEVFFCVLIWVPALRPLMLLMGTLMHVGIGAFMGMWTFGLIMTFAYFSFSAPEKWRRWMHRSPGRATALENSLRDVTTLTPASAAGTSATAASAAVMSAAPASHPVTPQPVSPDRACEVVAPLPTPARASVLIVSVDAEERHSLRRYLRDHDIPCRATMSAELALTLILQERPAIILLSGTRLTGTQIQQMVGDLLDGTDSPIIAMTTERQQSRLTAMKANVTFLKYPVSLREIRQALTDAVFGAVVAAPNTEYSQTTATKSLAVESLPAATSASNDSDHPTRTES
ncbi:MAG: HTTM domain-containing protein [Planctomycetaceae bacterium]|nr:HTTM domain-containing protein [Planctomycetaceae bacterium]